ncbi:MULTISPECIES: hypothetical protein [Acidobacterium]|nr:MULTISPECIES: hypothetical protein [Acidobacterium]HCT61855.1 hypothetical protein [Acidobacterium sp.]
MITQAPAALTPLELAQRLEAFLAEHPSAAVLEEGAMLFDMRLARYSVTSEHNRCMLHLWSDQRNLVRTVTGMRARSNSLLIETRRFGQTRPQSLLMLAEQERRTPTARDSSRRQYLQRLQRVVTSHFEGTPESFSTALDMEQSLGPAYARGLLARGPSAWAVLGVNAQEDASTITNAVTLGILWLQACRERLAKKRVVEGLRLFLPRGMAQGARERMRWLSRDLAKWELYELSEDNDELTPLEITDTGNLAMEVRHAFDPEAAMARMREGLQSLLDQLPESLRTRTEIRPRSATEVALLLHGLEYARVRHEPLPGSFRLADRITFGAGRSETELTEETASWLLDLAARLAEDRKPGGNLRNPLYRMQPEPWLESQLRQHPGVIDPMLRGDFLYEQVPALSAADRGLMDLLTVTRNGRLVVMELKAEEDPHLPLQALDYWMRVRTLHRSGELQRHGYFTGIELSQDDPMLYLIAPALRLHPTYPVVLQYLSREIEWQVIGLDEHWRTTPRVILRRRPNP